MKKSDLENGMIMQMRNGKKYMIFDYYALGIEGFIYINSLDDDLKNLDNISSWDVVKVYELDGGFNKGLGFNGVLSPDGASGKLLWERKPIKEMTLEEVCKALGYDVKIVKK